MISDDDKALYAAFVFGSTAYTGKTWPITIWPVRFVQCCGNCIGSGREGKPHYATCKACKGTGYPNGQIPLSAILARKAKAS